MTDRYLRSTDGSDSDNGSTWALAKATLAGIASAASAGDTTYVSQVHAETSASAIQVTMPGTIASPTRVICGNDGAAPPTSAATTGAISTTGASHLVIRGSGYFYGLVLTCGNGFNFAVLSIGGNDSGATGPIDQTWESCDFILADTHPSSQLSIGTSNSGDSGKCRLINCRLKTTSSSHYVGLSGWVHLQGGSFISSGLTIGPYAFAPGGATRDGMYLFEGVDLSALPAATHLFTSPTSNRAVRAVIRNCKLPASWTGSLVDSTPYTAAAARFSMYNCQNGATTQQLWIEDTRGTIRQELTILQSGSVSGLTWKMTSNSTASETAPLASDEIVVPVTSTGSSKSTTVEIVHDSGTALTDAEVWVEATYLGTSGQTIGSLITDQRATVLTTAANQTTSAVTWTTTGLSSPNKQKLVVTFTPQVAGFVHLTIKLAKASKTIYVNPEATVT